MEAWMKKFEELKSLMEGNRQTEQCPPWKTACSEASRTRNGPTSKVPPESSESCPRYFIYEKNPAIFCTPS
jgi:hypothetical protein